MTTPRAKKIEALRARLAALQAEEQAAAARARAAASKASRTRDAKKKILVGAFMLWGLGDRVLEVTLDGQSLAQWLTRDDERALFNLPPLASAAATPATALPPGSAVSAAGAAPYAEGGAA